MMNQRLTMCCLLLMDVISGVLGQSDQSAQNVSAITGDRVQFNCFTDSYDSSPEWYHAYIGYINPIAVFKDDTLQPGYDTGRFSVETTSPGNYDLIIEEVEMDDAGDFICTDGTPTGDVLARTSLHVEDGFEDLSVKPQNVVAIVGSNVTILCSTTYKSTSVWWKHRPAASIELKDVYLGFGGGLMNGYAAGRRHSVDTDPDTGKYNLIIRNVESRDAGTYVCVDQDGLGHKSSAELTVIEKLPECSSSIILPEATIAERNCKPDLIQMGCQVRYSGAHKPTLSWLNPAGLSPSTSTLVENGVVVSTLRFTMSPAIEDHIFICYIEGTEEHSCQLTVPTNTFGLANWTQMNTIDKPQLFNCSSITSSNTCEHSWIKEDDEVVSSGPLLLVDSAGKYYCKATCSVRGLPCMVLPMAVEFRGIEGLPPYSVALIASGLIFGSLLFCCLIVIVFLYTKKHRWSPVKVEVEMNDAIVFTNNEPTMPLTIKVDTPGTHKLWNDGKKFKSFAMLNTRMYVVYQRCQSVYVYNNIEQLRLIDEIVVVGMRAPKDIAACEKYNCLYISDSEVKCIWKISFNDPKGITKYASDFNAPYGITVSPSGTIVTVDEVQNNDGSTKTNVLLYHRKTSRTMKKIDPGKITKPIKYAMMMSKHTCIACLEREIVGMDKFGNVLRHFPDESHPGFLKNLLPIVVQANDNSLLLLDVGSSKVYILSEEFTLLGEPQDIHIKDPQTVKKIGYHENQIIVALKSGSVLVETITNSGASGRAETSLENNNNNNCMVDYDFDESDSDAEGKPILPAMEQETNEDRIQPELTRS